MDLIYPFAAGTSSNLRLPPKKFIPTPQNIERPRMANPPMKWLGAYEKGLLVIPAARSARQGAVGYVLLLRRT